MHCWIELGAAALRHNFEAFSSLLGKERVVPILKSNAYGHGLRETYQILAGQNPQWIGTNYVFESVELRKLGYKGRLLMVGPFLASEMETAIQHDIELFVGSSDGVTAWFDGPAGLKVHLEFDTGMSRQGLNPDDAQAIAEKVKHAGRDVIGLCMHFANVEDVTEHSYASSQLEKFEKVRAVFSSQGFKPLCHASSSASALLLQNARFDLCRVGISLYGFWPSQATRLSYMQLGNPEISLKPVLSWKTKITSVTSVKAGQFIGYGCTYRARHAMRIAVLPVGYFEGYPRIASGTNAYVLIRGERCPIVGRICMNMMMVDVTDVVEAATGDETVLIGKQSNEHISASDVAAWSQTIHYELVTRLNSAMLRVLK